MPFKTCDQWLKLVTRGTKLVTRGTKVVTRGTKPVTRGTKPVTSRVSVKKRRIGLLFTIKSLLHIDPRIYMFLGFEMS